MFINHEYRTLLHDPRLYKDPLEFQPDRFTDVATTETEVSSELPSDPYTYAFGFGRRYVVRLTRDKNHLINGVVVDVVPASASQTRHCGCRWHLYSRISTLRRVWVLTAQKFYPSSCLKAAYSGNGSPMYRFST